MADHAPDPDSPLLAAGRSCAIFADGSRVVFPAECRITPCGEGEGDPPSPDVPAWRVEYRLSDGRVKGFDVRAGRPRRWVEDARRWVMLHLWQDRLAGSRAGDREAFLRWYRAEAARLDGRG